MKTIKRMILVAVLSLMVSSLAGSVSAAPASGAAVKNTKANQNACWGMDRAYYASMGYFPENMDIKQSFPGEVGEQRAAWIDTYCWAHGAPTE